MKIAFTAWDYDVTYIEMIAAIAALVAVGLAIKGTRWAWPFYLLTALLYMILFINVDLVASAALQPVYMASAIWGWFNWGRGGIKESKFLANRTRVIVAIGLIIVWIALTPILTWMGGAATWLDAFVLIGSVAAQLLMVLGYVESWVGWVIVDAVGTYHYANQNLWFTSGLYFVLFLMAMWGWREWAKRSAGDLAEVPEPSVAGSA